MMTRAEPRRSVQGRCARAANCETVSDMAEARRAPSRPTPVVGAKESVTQLTTGRVAASFAAVGSHAETTTVLQG